MPDSILRVFNFDPKEFDGPNASIQRLAYAVFEDGVACLLRLGQRSKREKDDLQRNALAWVSSDDVEYWVWSFDAICHTLGLPAPAIRSALLAEDPRIQRRYDRLAHKDRRAKLPIEQIQQDVKNGRFICELAKEYRVTRRAIAEVCDGMVRQRRTDRNTQLREAYQKGCRVELLTQMFDVSPATVRRVCKEVRRGNKV